MAGFSQGGTVAVKAALSSPQPFAGVVAFSSGYFVPLPNVQLSRIPGVPRAVPPLPLAIRRTPLWCEHHGKGAYAAIACVCMHCRELWYLSESKKLAVQIVLICTNNNSIRGLEQTIHERQRIQVCWFGCVSTTCFMLCLKV